MLCPDCVALRGASASVPPHAALTLTGEENPCYGPAGHDSSEDYECRTCRASLNRHTGRLDVRIWTVSDSAHNPPPTVPPKPLYDAAVVRSILEPLGFTVAEAETMGHRSARARRALAATYRQAGWGTNPAREVPLHLVVSFPSGLVEREIAVGVEGVGDFCGPSYTIRDLDHLRASAPNFVSFFEQNSTAFLCPSCRGLMRMRSGKNGAFFSCIQYPTCKGTRNAISQGWP